MTSSGAAEGQQWLVEGPLASTIGYYETEIYGVTKAGEGCFWQDSQEEAEALATYLNDYNSRLRDAEAALREILSELGECKQEPGGRPWCGIHNQRFPCYVAEARAYFTAHPEEAGVHD